MSDRYRTDHLALVAMVIVTSLLVLPGLGGSALWWDEAHTAVVARNILNHGLPVAFDGENVVSMFADRHDIRHGLQIWQAMLPAYLSAASMAVLGVDAFGARFPFALTLIVLVAVSYRVFSYWDPGRRRNLIAVALMLSCIPLLLHARQSRYYLLVPLFNVLVMHAYLRVLERPEPIRLVALVGWMTVLFNSFYPGAPVLALALGIDVVRRRPDRRAIAMFCWAGAIFLMINLPIAVFARVWDRTWGASGHGSLELSWAYFLRYVLTINTFFFPLILVLVAGVRRWRNLLNFKRVEDDFFFLLVSICVTQLVAFSLLSDFPFTRYLIGLAPFAMFLGARCILSLSASRLMAGALVVLVATTNVIHVLPLLPLQLARPSGADWTIAGVDSRFLEAGNVGVSYARGEIKEIIDTKPGSPMLGYLRSILHPPKGPIDWIVEHLKNESAASDRVKISYGDLPLMFHTDLTVTSAADVGPPAPEWLIIRHFNPLKTNANFARNTPTSAYVAEELPVSDVQWNNRPDPIYHRYRAPDPDLAPKVRILRKRAPITQSANP